MSFTAEQLAALVTRCEQFRGSENPKGYPQSLALCIVDSVQSTGVKYASVETVVNRYVSYRKGANANAYTDGTEELLATFKDRGGPEGWSEEIGNGHRTSTHAGAPLKAVAIHDVAVALKTKGIATTAGLRQAAKDEVRYAELRKAWCSVVGQRSGITWRYAGMLAGVDGVKPDRMICRFVCDSLGLPRRVGVDADLAAEIVTAAARKLDMSATALDHAIWRFQRGQR